jgi:hypothetical protein
MQPDPSSCFIRVIMVQKSHKGNFQEVATYGWCVVEGITGQHDFDGRVQSARSTSYMTSFSIQKQQDMFSFCGHWQFNSTVELLRNIPFASSHWDDSPLCYQSASSAAVYCLSPEEMQSSLPWNCQRHWCKCLQWINMTGLQLAYFLPVLSTIICLLGTFEITVSSAL